MKCARLHRKQIGTLLLVGVLMILLALPVFAVQNRTWDGTTATQIDVSAYYEMPTYSVELSWGGMEFKYLYGVGWDYSNQTFNQITLTNLTAVPVGVDLAFEESYGSYTGTFSTAHDGNGDSYDALYLSANKGSSEPTGSVYLILNDVRPVNTDSQTIGKITLKLVDVLDSNLNIFESQYEPNKIGHVTRNMGIVPFDKYNLER